MAKVEVISMQFAFESQFLEPQAEVVLQDHTPSPV